MAAYTARRLTLFLPTLFVVSVLAFCMVRIIPGDIVNLMLQENGGGVRAQELRERLGLTQPIYTQYLKWVGDIAHGDFGRSLWSGQSAAAELKLALPITLELGLMTLVISVLAGVGIGVLAAVRQGGAIDYVARSFSVLALSLPHFWIATILIIYPAIWWGMMPSVSYVPFLSDPLANLAEFLLPALILGLHGSAGIMRFTRTMMLEVLRHDYVRTARAKGLGEWTTVAQHALKNALIPVLTLIGVTVPFVLGGTVIMESIFALPGMGQLTLQAITQRDYPILQAIVLIYTLIVIVTNLAVDLAYGWFDPRIRYD